MPSRAELFENAKHAIDELYNDMSVPYSEIYIDMYQILGYIRELIGENDAKTPQHIGTKTTGSGMRQISEPDSEGEGSEVRNPGIDL